MVFRLFLIFPFTSQNRSNCILASGKEKPGKQNASALAETICFPGFIRLLFIHSIPLSVLIQ